MRLSRGIKFKNMNEEQMYLLLNIVKNNGDIKKLTRLGVKFRAIAELTESFINSELIKYDNGVISITEKGLDSITNLEGKYKQFDKNSWIEPKNDCKISTIDKDFVFLPMQDELHF